MSSGSGTRGTSDPEVYVLGSLEESRFYVYSTEESA